MTQKRWYRGNLHTHTTASDGDASPEETVRWYRRHGYDFLVLSDHNHRTILNHAGKRRLKRPLMIPGEEVTLRIKSGQTAIHLGAIGISRMVEPIDADDVLPTIQANVNAILEAGGIASINHPNYTWAFDHEQIKQVKGTSLLEIYTGDPTNNSIGALGKLSVEQIWDGVLSAGKPIFGVATDDSHHYHDFAPHLLNPGRAWVVVRSSELSQEAIVSALAAGDFYASSGVTLAELETSRSDIYLRVEPEKGALYWTDFIGKDGMILSQVEGTEAVYRIRGDEGYVRAQVMSSRGFKAWTQPVFL